MSNGLIIVTDQTGLPKSKQKGFRSKKLDLENRTKLVSFKGGVYFIPFEKNKPSEEEVDLILELQERIKEFKVKATYYYATQTKVKTVIESTGLGAPMENGVSFLIEPIKVYMGTI